MALCIGALQDCHAYVRKPHAIGTCGISLCSHQQHPRYVLKLFICLPPSCPSTPHVVYRPGEDIADLEEQGNGASSSSSQVEEQAGYTSDAGEQHRVQRADKVPHAFNYAMHAASLTCTTRSLSNEQCRNVHVQYVFERELNALPLLPVTCVANT